MTPQEVYDKVKTHLLTQGKRAVVEDHPNVYPEGVYRTAAGLKCAIGCLIPDELYNPDLEGASACSPGVWGLISQAHDLAESLRPLIHALQGVHDNPLLNPAKDWEPALQNIALRFDLIP